ncbi:hypothetical protein B0H10DRAFT_1775019 [Mycena sp. CBHHK59/15]|nr:hypothetical protein B0H10DRAFT_1775019 [Mycena sp. CBHHK59/15]
MGFWEPDSQISWFCPADFEVPVGTIFFLEALCVAAAVDNVDPEFSLRKIVIYNDNQNTVDIFNTLAALLAYNPILTSTIDILFQHDFDLRVLHVPGSQNDVADAISRQEFDRAHSLVPDLIILPPPAALGAAKK